VFGGGGFVLFVVFWPCFPFLVGCFLLRGFLFLGVRVLAFLCLGGVLGGRVGSFVSWGGVGSLGKERRVTT